MSEESLLFERVDGVVTLTLNRPAVGNAIDLNLARSLMEKAIRCDEEDGVRCVILTGTGRLFCAGGDLASFAQAGSGFPNLIKEILSYLHKAIARFVGLKVPIITAVNGPAAGAGFSLAMLGDVVLAGRAAHFTLAYTLVGLSPDGGSTWLLPRLVGLRRAQELSLLNKRLSAEEAAQAGLVTRVVDDASLAEEARRVASELNRAATGALGRTRNLLRRSFESTLEEQLEAEARAMVESSKSAESKEGIAAFLAKRKADFRSAGTQSDEAGTQ